MKRGNACNANDWGTGKAKTTWLAAAAAATQYYARKFYAKCCRNPKNCKYADDGSSGNCSKSTMCEVGVFVALAAVLPWSVCFFHLHKR